MTEKVKTTIRFGDAIAELGTPEAESLVGNMLQNEFRAKRGAMMELKVVIKNIDELKTSSFVEETKNKNGDLIARRLKTKFQFVAEVNPPELIAVHRLMAAVASVHVMIGSPQSIMLASEKVGAFAEA